MQVFSREHISTRSSSREVNIRVPTFLFYVVDFSRGTFPQKRGKRALLGVCLEQMQLFQSVARCCWFSIIQPLPIRLPLQLDFIGCRTTNKRHMLMDATRTENIKHTTQHKFNRLRQVASRPSCHLGKKMWPRYYKL